MKLHELSVKRPVAVTMAVLVFVVIGIYSLTMLPMEMMPKIDLSMAIVYTSYPNVGSEEVENLITKNIESSIASVSGVNSITSSSSEGTSMVTVEFSNSTDIDDAVQSISDNIDLISDYLPEGSEEPMIIKLDSSMMSTAMMSVSYEGYDLSQTKKFVENTVEDALKSVSGVASVNISGATDRIISVTLNPQKMYGYNISSNDIKNAIAAQNQNLPSGETEGMNKELAVRSVGKFSSLYDIGNVPINTSTGEIIHLSDIAEISDTFEKPTTYARLDGKDALSISINKESDANTVDVVEGIKNELEQIKNENPKFTYNITMEQASYIQNAISSVANSALTGGLLAIVILLLFLGSIKTSISIAISMPVSIVVTFIGMYFSGMTLNVVSLGGLALGVGMLVDNAVVVIENIFRRRDLYKEDPKTAASKGTGEVIGAVVASVLTTCIVYVPILFIDNMMAVMFKQLAFAIIFSQIASLLTTFLLIPMLSSKIKNTKSTEGFLYTILKPFNKILDIFYTVYEKILRSLLRHKKKTVIFTLIIFIICMGTLSRLGMTLMPSSDEGALSVSIELPAGAKLENTDEITRQVESIVMKNENVASVFSNVGSGGTSGLVGASSSNQASLTVTLKDDRNVTTAEVVNNLRKELENITGAILSLEASNTAMSSMSSDEIQFNYSGADEEELKNYIIEAEKILQTIDGVVETTTSLESTQPEIKVRLNSSKAAMYGMNTSTVSSAINSVLGNTTASRYLDNGTEYDIVICYPDSYIENYNQLKTLRIKALTGEWIGISDIADVTIEEGNTTLTRSDQKRVYTLTAKLFNTNMQHVNDEFDRKMQTIPKPDGIMKQESGSFEIMMDAMKSLLIAILLGILLMYMIMCAQFENIKQPFIILFTVPLALIGVVIALLITNSPLSVIGCIGILMLTGIIVNNAIVLIDFANTTKQEQPDMSINELMIYSGKARMRPILMTSLTSILGFLPMAVSTAEGSEMMQPLAVVLCGGLLIGTFLTLFFIPTLYAIFESDNSKKSRKRKLKKIKEKRECQTDF